MPHPVTTWSTVFFSVVTTEPSVSRSRMRLRPVLVLVASGAETVVLPTPLLPVTKAMRRAKTDRAAAPAADRESGGLRACALTPPTQPPGRAGVVRAYPRGLGGIGPMPRG